MFGPKGFEETPTLKRSNAFSEVKKEVKAVRESVGLLDITGFSRYEISGLNAEKWLNSMLATKLPKPGRTRLAVMLAPSGRLKGDLTIFNWGNGTFWLMGSYYLREWHMRWFEDNLRGNVLVKDISDNNVGFAIAGPKSRDLLSKLTHQDVSNEAVPFLSCKELDIGLIRAKIGRLSVCGELGYEINCGALEHITLRETLMDAGEEFNIKEFGFYAMNSLRLEKGFGVWSAEFRQDYTPFETGMDKWINWNKKDFIGKEKALRMRDNNSELRKLVVLEIESVDADASGYEPLWYNGKKIGFITSGGYGHYVEKSLAMALVDTPFSKPGTELVSHIVGKKRTATVIDNTPYDPDGSKMRI
tara:strand:- start:923 stop:1999 length:1077 start_codon:yes stop_codon:yes gene_type:complete